MKLRSGEFRLYSRKKNPKTGKRRSESCPPWYARTVIWRIISAKRPETRAKRLAELIACSEVRRSVPTLALSRNPQKKRGNARQG